MNKNVLFSTYIPRNSLSAAQGEIWLKSLITLGETNAANIVIHRPEGISDAFDQFAKGLEVKLIAVKSDQYQLPTLEKLCQLEALKNFNGDTVVLMSPATAITQSAVFTATSNIHAKIVDNPNPDINVLKTIFAAAKVPFLSETDVSIETAMTRPLTQRNYCNNRLYIFKEAFLRRFAPFWQKWARWCEINKNTLGDASAQSDQISYALAMSDIGEYTQLLALNWNYPAHLPAKFLPNTEPKIVFFHDKINNQNQIVADVPSKVASAISKINTMPKIKLAAPVALQQKPKTLPPGQAGADGGTKVSHSNLIENITYGFDQKTVLQIGLTDLSPIKTLSGAQILGIDQSADKVLKARQAFPDQSFKAVTETGLTNLPKADLVIAIDGVIDAENSDEYLQRIKSLAHAAKKRLIIRGREYQGREKNKYFGPISEHLKAIELFKNVIPVLSAGSEILVVADRLNDNEDHKTALKASKPMMDAAAFIENPALLRRLVDTAHAAFGFFTTEFVRAIELPWVIKELGPINTGQKILDLGTGLSPLPLYFADKGGQVTTADNHPVEATPENKENWHKAGFFDYGQLSSNCRSVRNNVMTLAPHKTIDIVSAVGVLNELNRGDRIELIKNIKDWLAPGGRIALTVRLIPGTKWLWPYVGRQEIARKEEHGHLLELKDWMVQAGFKIQKENHLKAIPHAQRDLWTAILSQDQS